MLRSPLKLAGFTGFALAAATTLSSAAGPAPDTPASVPVKTSRGEFQLLLSPPAPPAPSRPGGGQMVLLISGEGGWRHIDVLLAGDLAAAGCWVGGIDVTKYFWEPQDDRQALAADMRAFAAALARAAGRKEGSDLVLAGFSFGADLAPWVAGAKGQEGWLRGLIMIAPDETGSLQFRVLEILGLQPKEHIFSVADALASAGGIPAALIHGQKDDGSAAPTLAATAREPKKIFLVDGADHHFSGKEAQLKTASRRPQLDRFPGAQTAA